MDLMPFIRLAMPRTVNQPELPADLAEFYAWHEGVGLQKQLGASGASLQAE